MNKKALQVVEICSSLEPGGPISIETIRTKAESYLHSNPERGGAKYLQQVIQFADLTRAAIDQNNAAGAAFGATRMMQAAWKAELSEGRMMIDIGVKLYRRAEAVNLARAAVAKQERAEWKEAAIRIRSIPGNEKMSKCDIALLIDRQRWNTIRRHI